MFISTLYKDKGHHIGTVYFKSVLSQSLAKRELGKKAFCIPTLLSAGLALLLVAWAERKRVFRGYGFGPEQGRSRMNTMHTHLTPTHLPLQTGKGLRICCTTGGQEEMVMHCCLGLWQTSTCLSNGQSEDESMALKKVHPPTSGDSSETQHYIWFLTLQTWQNKSMCLLGLTWIPLILNFSAKIPWLN